MRDCSRRCVYCARPLALDTATLDHVLPVDFFARFPWAGLNFMRYARAVHRALKRGARRAVSLALAAYPLAS